MKIAKKTPMVAIAFALMTQQLMAQDYPLGEPTPKSETPQTSRDDLFHDPITTIAFPERNMICGGFGELMKKYGPVAHMGNTIIGDSAISVHIKDDNSFAIIAVGSNRAGCVVGFGQNWTSFDNQTPKGEPARHTPQ